MWNHLTVNAPGVTKIGKGPVCLLFGAYFPKVVDPTEVIPFSDSGP